MARPKMDIKVKEIMRTKVVSLRKSDLLADAIGVFIENPDMAFPVLDEHGEIIGEVNQHDLLKLAVPANYIDGDKIMGPRGIKQVLERSGTTVADIMRENHSTIGGDASVLQAAKTMLDTGDRTLEVIDDEHNPIGFISEIDILGHLKRSLEEKK